MKKTVLIVMVIILGFINTTFAQGAKMKSLFIFNFTKYVEWPSSAQQGDFVIGVIGDKEFYKVLSETIKGKRVGSRSILVENYDKVEDLKDCHLIFLPEKKTNQISSVLAYIENKNVLLVSDRPGTIKKGAGINFIQMNNKLSFEIKKENIEKYNLKVSNNLLNLGVKK